MSGKLVKKKEAFEQYGTLYTFIMLHSINKNLNKAKKYCNFLAHKLQFKFKAVRHGSKILV